MCNSINGIRQGYWHLKPILPNLKRLIYFSPNENYSISKNSLSLLSPSEGELSTMFYFRDAEGMNIVDIESSKKGCGYGTKLLNKFLQIFNDCKISVTATYDRNAFPVPPHKFYMKNGFIPIDKNAEIAIKDWISRGGNIKDFPHKYDSCLMVRNA